MARDEEYELNKKKEKLADECIVLVLESITAFFQGKAIFEISPSQPGIPQSVRFIKDGASV